MEALGDRLRRPSNNEGVDEVMDMYDKDLQPFLGMALGGPEVEGVYAFLDKEGVGNGGRELTLVLGCSSGPIATLWVIVCHDDLAQGSLS